MSSIAFFSTRNTILTVMGSLQFSIDCYSFTSERKLLTHCSSWPQSSNIGSSCLWLIEMDAADARQRLMVHSLMFSDHGAELKDA